MATIQSAIRRLAKAPGKTLDDPRKPEQISGTTALLTWPQENAAQDAGGGGSTEAHGSSEAFEHQLFEIPGRRTYFETREIFDEEGVTSVEVQAVRSIVAEDSNGNQITVFLSNPYN